MFKTVTVSVATCFDNSGHSQGIKFYKNINELQLHWLLSFDRDFRRKRQVI